MPFSFQLDNAQGQVEGSTTTAPKCYLLHINYRGGSRGSAGDRQVAREAAKGGSGCAQRENYQKLLLFFIAHRSAVVDGTEGGRGMSVGGRGRGKGKGG